MELKTLCVLARCASFELATGLPYNSPTPFEAYLDGAPAGRFTTNVFTLYGLQPGREYQLQLRGIEAAPLAFATPAEPACLNVLAFGAVGDGVADCTPALQAALAACPAGGTVLVPAGVYRTGPLFMASGVTLYLEKGAVLQCKSERDAFPVLPGLEEGGSNGQPAPGTWEGEPVACFASLVTALHQRDFAVAGQGVLDGGGAEGDWWLDHRTKRGAWRPRTVFWNGCENARMVGVTVRNSPSWTIHPYYSDNLAFVDITVQNPSDSPNTDGLNPESCRGVLVAGVRISVGDDCIAIKSGKLFMGTHFTKPSADITIRNCLMERGHGAVVLGSEVSGGVRDIRVEDCLMVDTDRGLRVKTRRGRGATSVVTGLHFARVHMRGVCIPFAMNMYYFCDDDGHSEYVQSRKALPVDERTPTIGRLSIESTRCEGCQAAGIYALGLPESPIGEITLRDVYIGFAKQARAFQPVMADGVPPAKRLGIVAENVRRLALENVTLEGYEGERLSLTAVGELSGQDANASSNQ